MNPIAMPRAVLLGLAGLLAIFLGWRVLAAGEDALQRRKVLAGEISLGPALGASGADAEWRQRFARNPAEGRALAMLALELERQGQREQAAVAMGDALRLSPADLGTLQEAISFYLRTGDEAKALAALWHAAETVPVRYQFSRWDLLLAALDSGRHRHFFGDIARRKSRVWPGFFKLACEGSGNVAALRAMFDARVKAGLGTAEERGCVIDRLQRANLWSDAYVLWVNGLAPGERERIGLVFNGSFELPLSNRGFDWRMRAQEGVQVSTEFADGSAERQVLHVAYASALFAGPPIHQSLLLTPGRYRFDARARLNLESWRGLQWALYCRDEAGRETGQLFATDRLIGLSDWKKLHNEFSVPANCPVQTLRLELAPSRSEANSAEEVRVRLKGDLWFDDLVARKID